MALVVTWQILCGLVAVVLSAALIWRSRKLTRRWMTWIGSGLGTVLLVVAATGLIWAVALATGDRSTRSIDFGSDLRYERTALTEPHRQVFHLVMADLDNPCLELVTSRPGTDGIVAAETGTEFVDRTGVAVSINLAFFYPFDEYPHWSAYPRSGDPVTAIGPTVINGQWLGDIDGGWDAGLAVTNGVLSVGPIPVHADFAVSGLNVIVADGQVVPLDSERYPRSVAGIDLETNQLLLLVTDGKQPGYASGSTYQDVAEFLVARGADYAIEFDGGGSATMAATVDGEVELLSRPSHQRIPGRQRPVATHLGIAIDSAC